MLNARERERAALRKATGSGQPVLIEVSGRPGIGKTFLVTHAWPDQQPFYFLATRSTPDLIRAELSRELSRWSDRPIEDQQSPAWKEIFANVRALAGSKPLIVVLDGVQEIYASDSTFAGALATFWRDLPSNCPLTLVLCGTTERNPGRALGHHQALANLIDLSIDLQPLDYLDAASMLPGRSAGDLLTLYATLGGLPGYLAHVPTGQPVERMLIDLIVDPKGPVRQEIERFVDQAFTGHEREACPAILSVLTTGTTSPSEVVERTGLTNRAVLRAVNALEDLGLVATLRTFQASANHPRQIRLADNAFSFYYQFVHANRSWLATAPVANVWAAAIAPHLNDVVDRAFSQVAMQALSRHHTAWNLAKPVEVGHWLGVDRNRRLFEFDLVALLEDDRVLIGDVRWSTEPLGPKVHRDLTYNVQLLARSGIPWAVAASNPATSAGQLYLSAAGFTDDFLALAANDPSIHLATLDDLYYSES